MIKLIGIVVFFFSSLASAYPDFISYGYNTCISCHYNSHGYGPLTDYGKALFSQEIAARNFWTPKSVDDETIAEKSARFIPFVDLPYWVRPNIKYRGLYLERNPGSQGKTVKWYRMQRDFNLVLSTSDSYRTIVALNYGLLHEQNTNYYGDGPVDAVSREHYIRLFPLKKLLLAAGLMDIAYGLRTGDHTSVSRGSLGLGQDDQVHGVMFQWFEDSWDATLHTYVGNLFRDEANQRKGASVQAEYLTSETNKVGFSVMQANTESLKAQRFAIHNRHGLANAPGSSILAELGFRSDERPALGTPATQGMYGMVQSIIHLTRGYNILSTVERYQSELKNNASERSRWTLGMLMFPLQQTELRLNMVQAKGYSPTAATNDETQFQGQVHVSW